MEPDDVVVPRLTGRMPFLIMLGFGLSVLGAVFFGWSAVGSFFDLSPIVVNTSGSPMPVVGQVFWVTPIATVFSILLGSIAYGIRRERPWWRSLVVAWWVLIVTLSALWGFSGRGLLGAAVLSVPSVMALVLSTWYLYGKRSVVAYFTALEIEQGASV